MAIVGGGLATRILMRLSPTGRGGLSQGTPKAYQNQSKLEVLLGPSIWEEIRDKTVIDFGCGEGIEAVELSEHGARHVIGIDLWDYWLWLATERARQHGVSDRCTFAPMWDGRTRADIIISLDSFEHFDDPAAILTAFQRMLKPDGSVIACFGPTWYHPYGGHLYSIFPWAHFIFTEKALVAWRSTLPNKSAVRSFRETGLNQMTIARFETLVEQSPFRFASFEAVPIRRLRWAATGLLREFTTSIVRCRLEPRHAI
ncbi:MAG TPA: class I SAM-dependent methyltransferase [Vicinamibacterales bacterium]|nr:class I SAM-dependent methyltransferase [Vicinamibacterales bacterium]